MEKSFVKVKNAFTLAEVLITLVVIGVIAAMTIPNVINNTKKHEYVSGLKKAYSTLKSVTNQIMVEEGAPRGDAGGWAKSSENIGLLYKSKLNISKECLNTVGCFEQLSNSSPNYYVSLGGNQQATGNLNAYTSINKVVLADGTQIAFLSPDESCNGSGSFGVNYCAAIYIDINGQGKPNRLGRDFFVFLIKEDGLYPAGCDSNTYCTPDGWGCACKVLRENAMNY